MGSCGGGPDADHGTPVPQERSAAQAVGGMQEATQGPLDTPARGATYFLTLPEADAAARAWGSGPPPLTPGAAPAWFCPGHADAATACREVLGPRLPVPPPQVPALAAVAEGSRGQACGQLPCGSKELFSQD